MGCGYVEALEERVYSLFEQLGISQFNKDRAMSEIKDLRTHHADTYSHQLRLALLSCDVAEFLGIPKRPLFFASLMHDVGKKDIDKDLLAKKDRYTQEERTAIEKHVDYTHARLAGKFEVAARIADGHHANQSRPYPAILPKGRVKFPESMEQMIEVYRRILSLIDAYDSMVSRDDGYRGKQSLSDAQVKEELAKERESVADLAKNLVEKQVLSRKYLPSYVQNNAHL